MHKKAFTVVELIVVITILAVLATVAFVSFQGVTIISRNSVRLSDTTNMRKTLEIYHFNDSKYPLPDNYGTMTYNSNDLYYQGTFGKEVIKKVARYMSMAPLDPLTDLEYIYSVTANRDELEILKLLEGSDIALNQISQTNAADITVIPKINGNYNGIFIKTATDIVPLPSIINTEIISESTITLDATNISSMVTNLGKNIPNHGNIVSNSGALTNLQLSVYNGTITDSSSDTEKLAVYNKIAAAYLGSSLENNPIIEELLSKTTDAEKIASTETTVLNSTTASNNSSNTVVIDPNIISLPGVKFTKFNGKTSVKTEGSSIVMSNSDSLNIHPGSSIEIPMLVTDVLTDDFSLSFDSENFSYRQGFLGISILDDDNGYLKDWLIELAGYQSVPNRLLKRINSPSYAYISAGNDASQTFSISRSGNTIEACIGTYCTYMTQSGNVKIGIYYTYVNDTLISYESEKTLSNFLLTQ